MIMHNALVPLLVIGTVASLWDLRTGRIPNLLTLGAAVSAIAFHLTAGGPRDAAWSLAGWAVGCAVFLPVFLLGGMGAGDVKLLAAIGAWVGPIGAIPVAFFTAIAGGVMAIAVAFVHGYLRRALSNVWVLLCYWRVVGVRPVDDMTLAAGAGPRLAYALPITAGSLVAWWWFK
jgi:prepilin peptidase CpaA